MTYCVSNREKLYLVLKICELIKDYSNNDNNERIYIDREIKSQNLKSNLILGATI